MISWRAFILVAVGLLVQPLAAGAQPPGKPAKVGLLQLGTPEADTSRRAAAFREGLRELKWTEVQDILLDYRNAPGNLDRAYPLDQLVPLAAELAWQKVDVMVAFGTLSSLAARQATAAIPIVMAGAENPVQNNLIASLGRPGGNVTGLTQDVLDQDLDPKRLELLKEPLPRVSRVAVSTTQARGYQ